MLQGWCNSSRRDWEQFFTFGDGEREGVVVRVSGCGLELAPEVGRQPLRASDPCKAASPKPFPSAHIRLQAVLWVIPGLIHLLYLCSCVSGRSNPRGWGQV